MITLHRKPDCHMIVEHLGNFRDYNRNAAQACAARADEKIRLISNPATGDVMRSSMCHEWVEAIPQAKKYYKMMTIEQRHAIIASAHI